MTGIKMILCKKEVLCVQWIVLCLADETSFWCKTKKNSVDRNFIKLKSLKQLHDLGPLYCVCLFKTKSVPHSLIFCVKLKMASILIKIYSIRLGWDHHLGTPMADGRESMLENRLTKIFLSDILCNLKAIWMDAIASHSTLSCHIARYTVIIRIAELIRQHKPIRRRNLGWFALVISVTSRDQEKGNKCNCEPKIYVYSESCGRNPHKQPTDLKHGLDLYAQPLESTISRILQPQTENEEKTSEVVQIYLYHKETCRDFM